MKKNPLKCYQQQRQLTGSWQLEGLVSSCSMAVIIPALGEGEQLWATLESIATNPAIVLENTLVVVIINCRVDSDPELVCQNKIDLAELRGGRHFGALRLAWIDASSADRQLPFKQGGVGMARKIASDLLLPYLTDDGLLIHLDADTVVDERYLQSISDSFVAAHFGAAVIPYCHQPGEDSAGHRSIILYELYLRCHVLGLQLAGSPYAYHSIGSTMVCTCSAYIKAGGMNCRLAGEDFYFLQQLTKTGGMGLVSGTVVRPAARISQRTPFGTGQVVRQLSNDDDATQRFYAPQCYSVLQQWLALVNECLHHDAVQLMAQVQEISPMLADFLQQEQFVAVWERLCRTHSQYARRQHAFHEWFDGLKTMRCIHHLSEHVYPMADAKQHVPPLLRYAELECGDAPEQWLATLRKCDLEENPVVSTTGDKCQETYQSRRDDVGSISTTS
ncbi:MAG: hypothetical protein U9R29_01800 [Thermodesulfobacteriota bacterium]|nr:hypothetical protein [Thermodesulfobacteriota bacterium]